ncbi:MAG: HlyD family type I secretion periplasmic adaptor subunit [Hyphomicrobiaceae bacterium]|nr:HlyD family type I secretion periplasmic adaptor subunit [Hyphomicrobiaceae bacterium]
MIGKIADMIARARGPSEKRVIDPYAPEPWVKVGNRVLVGLVCGLLLCGLVSISGAVVAPGVVNVENNYKAVQHLDGGIVAKINVRNGDRVTEGDVVVRLDETAVRAAHAVASARVNALLVQQARLEAERDRLHDLTLPPEVAQITDDPALSRLIETQRTLFEARRRTHTGELAVLAQRKAQLAEELNAAEQGLAARKKESAINARELASLRPLYQKGYANQQRYLPVERDAARLEGDVGRLGAEMARVKSGMAEVELRMQQSEMELTHQTVDELRKVQAALAEALEQRTALADKLQRAEVRAPRSGRVNALAVHTEGGVIPPGGTIMQIVPDGERLIIDAQIPPQEIDKVGMGQPAYVRFPAFNARFTPRLQAQVLTVSPAQITDQQGRSYFLVQVTLADGELQKLPTGLALIPGMPAELFIETGNRSILSYFVKPLTDVVARTFRES